MRKTQRMRRKASIKIVFFIQPDLDNISLSKKALLPLKTGNLATRMRNELRVSQGTKDADAVPFV